MRERLILLAVTIELWAFLITIGCRYQWNYRLRMMTAVAFGVETNYEWEIKWKALDGWVNYSDLPHVLLFLKFAREGTLIRTAELSANFGIFSNSMLSIRVVVVLVELISVSFWLLLCAFGVDDDIFSIWRENTIEWANREVKEEKPLWFE